MSPTKGVNMELISVKDRLPEENIDLVFFYDNRYHIGYFIGKSEFNHELLWQSYVSSYNCIRDIEYWMPLPKPPKV